MHLCEDSQRPCPGCSKQLRWVWWWPQKEPFQCNWGVLSPGTHIQYLRYQLLCVMWRQAFSLVFPGVGASFNSPVMEELEELERRVSQFRLPSLNRIRRIQISFWHQQNLPNKKQAKAHCLDSSETTQQFMRGHTISLHFCNITARTL